VAIEELSLARDDFKGFGYSVTFRHDGTATDTRRRDRLPDQHFTGAVDPTEFDRVAGLVATSGFFALDERYGDRLPVVVTTAVRQGQTKAVSNFGGAGPANLVAVETAIESLRAGAGT
jgi:hypothetical protein